MRPATGEFNLMNKTSTMNTILRPTALATALLMTGLSYAQTAPDAGQVLQQNQQQAPQLPRTSPSINIQQPAAAVTLPGGQQVTLKGVTLQGNTVIDTPTLLASLGQVQGQTLDLAGLRALAGRIADHYRAAGYPFARAYLPPQGLEDGVLRIEVIEGRYGQVQAMSGDAALAAQAQPWLSALASGAVIESSLLERTTLLLDDLPGIQTAPVIKPGQAVGTGDLDVRVSRSQPMDGSVGLDNHGNRYTGYQRVRAAMNVNSPFVLGDQLSFSALGSDQDLWLGSASYSAPIGSSGLRGNLDHAHTRYEIGRELADSQSHGTADVSSVGLSYPWLRSQRANLTVAATFQHKRLRDGNLQSTERKRSDVVPISLQFDHRDGVGGGGVTFGNISWTYGRLQREAAGDELNTRGGFSKFNLDVARLQTLEGHWSLYGRWSQQTAQKNLDSSEGMSISGASGVRAYPVGELSGDEGWHVQLELRYSVGAYAPYVFYDQGRIRTNAKGEGPTRALAGAGVGLRYQRGAWTADAALAWRTEGGRPGDANERDARPRLGLMVAYRF